MAIATGCKQPSEKTAIISDPFDTLALIEERTAIDFPYTEKQIDRQLRKRIGRLSADEKTEMERRNWLEYKIINGERDISAGLRGTFS
ncbi:MAG: hypothetical protein IPI69_07985 [Bacteroidales bacterium]|nr:hypothetical protein [Bacteroidales bacterium]